jgi:hypothetical protein
MADFPDPTGGGMQAAAGPGSELDPNDPRFRRAAATCRSLLPPGGKRLPGAGG